MTTRSSISQERVCLPRLLGRSGLPIHRRRPRKARQLRSETGAERLLLLLLMCRRRSEWNLLLRQVARQLGAQERVRLLLLLVLMLVLR